MPARAASTTPLGPDDRFDEDDTILEVNEPDTTPTPAGGRNIDRSSGGNSERLTGEVQRLKEETEKLQQEEKEKTDIQNESSGN